MAENSFSLKDKIDWRNMKPIKHVTVYDELRKEKRMKVRMIVTKRGSIDGINVTEYQAGQTYDLTERLRSVFVDNGWAEEVKAFDQAPEIKEIKKGSRRRKR